MRRAGKKICNVSKIIIKNVGIMIFIFINKNKEINYNNDKKKIQKEIEYNNK